MSNRVAIVRTKFIDVKDGAVTHGYRIFDEYGTSYNNALDESDTPEDPIALISFVRENGDATSKGMLDHVYEHEKGVEVDGKWYDWDEIKAAFFQ